MMSFMPELGFDIWTEELVPPHLRGDNRPVRRSRPLGEIIGLCNIRSKQSTCEQGDRPVLNNLDLSIRRGEILGIVGRSAIERACLLRTINLLERPRAGEIVYAHEAVQHFESERLYSFRRKIGVLFREFGFLTFHSISHNLTLPMRLARWNSNEISRQAAALLALVHLEGKSNHAVESLSADEQSRLAIARAIALKPEVLLCEDPGLVLSPAGTERFLELVRLVNRRFGTTVVFSSDTSDAAAAVCDRLATVSDGKIQGESTFMLRTGSECRYESTVRSMNEHRSKRHLATHMQPVSLVQR